MNKFLAMFSLLMVFAGSVFAAGGIGGTVQKCQLQVWKCSLGAFSSCVEQYKYLDPTTGRWSVNPNSPEFKACEDVKEKKCMEDAGCK